MPLVDDALVGIGRVIGKPLGWERLVRALAPPSRFAGGTPHPMAVSEGYSFPVDPGTLIGWHIHFFGGYEPEVRQQLKRWLAPGDTAIDVGANVGWHALLMARLVGSEGHVYAFEPSTSTRARLQAASDANQLTQITTDPRAVSDRVGAAEFRAPRSTRPLWSSRRVTVRSRVVAVAVGVKLRPVADVIERAGLAASLRKLSCPNHWPTPTSTDLRNCPMPKLMSDCGARVRTSFLPPNGAASLPSCSTSCVSLCCFCLSVAVRCTCFSVTAPKPSSCWPRRS